MSTFTWKLQSGFEQSVATILWLISAKPTAWVRYHWCQRTSLAERKNVATSPDSPELCLSLQFPSAPLKAAIGNTILFHHLLNSKWVHKANEYLLLLWAASAFFPFFFFKPLKYSSWFIKKCKSWPLATFFRRFLSWDTNACRGEAKRTKKRIWLSPPAAG